ncbi:MAG: M48 family metalloprotease [Erysipelotrichales bacterium]|nr:M48 family metalloprotease [Erysipelotrichales bacterium]
MEKRTGKFIITSLIILVALVINVVIGMQLSDQPILALIMIFVGMFIIGCAVINNFIRVRRIKQEVLGLDPLIFSEEVEKLRSEGSDGFTLYRDVFQKLYKGIFIYYLLIALVANIVSQGFLILYLHYNGPSIIGTIIFTIVQFILIFELMPNTTELESSLEYSLDSKTYPILNETVKKAATLLNVNKNISLSIMPENNVVIWETTSCINIAVGVFIIRLLSESELFAVMIHEMGHALNGDLTVAKRISNLERLSSGLVAKFFASSLCIQVGGYAEKLKLAFSKLAEEKADLIVKENDYAKEYINGSAKIAIFADLYLLSLAEKNFYENEECPTSYYEMLFDKFLIEYDKKKDIWHKNLLKTFRPRLDSHPSFSERMINMVVSDFSINFEEFNVEAEKCFKKADEFVLPGLKEEWWELREKHYLSYKRLVEDFENGSTIELSEVVRAYEALCQYDKMSSYLDKLLARNSQNAFALYRKAIILASKFDDQCIDLFVSAIEQDFTLTEGLQLLKTYLTCSGNQLRYESLFSWSDKIMLDSFNYAKIEQTAAEENFAPCDLDEETKIRLTEKLIEADILWCQIIKVKTWETPLYMVFLMANSKMHNAYERAYDLFAQEKIHFIVYPEGFNLRAYRAARKLKLPVLFNRRFFEKSDIKEISKRRLAPILFSKKKVLSGVVMIIGFFVIMAFLILYEIINVPDFIIIVGIVLLLIGSIGLLITRTKHEKPFTLPTYHKHMENACPPWRKRIDTKTIFTDKKKQAVLEYLKVIGYKKCTKNELLFTNSYQIGRQTFISNIILQVIDGKLEIELFVKIKNGGKIQEYPLSNPIGSSKYLRQVAAVILEIINAPADVEKF